MNGSPAALEQLDQLGSRLEKFASSPKPENTVAPTPTPRKTSPGSMIPRPEVSPKPAFLSSLAVNAKMSRMAQSMKSPSKAKTSPTTANGNAVVTDAKTAASNAATKSAGTASILKSTLRRMTRLSINTSSTSTREKSSESNKGSPEERNGRAVSSRRSTSMNRSGSFREPEPYESRRAANGGIIPRNMPLSSSLRRPRNKDKEQPDYRGGFQRSGTGGTLERRGVNRSQSVTGRSRQNRDTIVRKSRAIQTQLTRDAMNDDLENNGGNGEGGISTSVDFSLHMPDLLGAEVDPVEMHYVEPSEPVDVRKNRELTLTNMRLQREVERLKLQIGDGEALKKEARTAKCKLEEERKARLRIEAELDRYLW